MIVGDVIQVTPTIDGIRRRPVMATVIYIHPKRRYYTVEWQVGAYKLRESFFFEHRRGED